MIKYIFSLYLALTLNCYISFAQYSFTFKVVDSANTNKCLFAGESYAKDFKTVIFKNDSLFSVNNSYTFVGNLLYPSPIRIFFDSPYSYFNQFFFIEPGYQEVVLKKDEKGILYISKRPTTKIETNYQYALKSFKTKTLDTLINEDLFLQYIKNNPSSYIGLFSLVDQSFFWRRLTPKIIEAASNFSDTIKNSKVYKIYKTHFLTDVSAAVYSNNPKITTLYVKDKFNKNIEFNPSNSKYTLLVVWFNECKPCREELKRLAMMYRDKEFKRKFRIISICTEGGEENIKKSIKILNNLGVIWTNYWDKDGKQLKKFIYLDYYPTNLLLDKDGIIKYKNIDISKLNEYVK